MKNFLLLLLLSANCLLAQIPSQIMRFDNNLVLHNYDQKDNTQNQYNRKHFTKYRISDQVLVWINNESKEEIICALNDSSIIKYGYISPCTWPCKNFFISDSICSIIISDEYVSYEAKSVYIFKKNKYNVWEIKNNYLSVLQLLPVSTPYYMCFLTHNIVLITYHRDWHRPDEIIVLKDDNTIERYLKETLPATKSPALPDKH